VIRERRRREQERRNRRIVVASVAIAAALHLVAFLVFPHVRFSVFGDARFGAAAERSMILGGMEVSLHFGPPLILLPDGSWEEEVEERVLDRERVAIGDLQVELTCADAFLPDAPPREGSVRLRVDPLGYARVVALESSTGEGCADRALEVAAGALWYRWLPNARYPAPVELIQPVRLQGVAEEE
jgi:hypothetical protein